MYRTRRLSLFLAFFFLPSAGVERAFADSHPFTQEQLVLRQLFILIDRSIDNSKIPSVSANLDEVVKSLGELQVACSRQTIRAFSDLRDGSIVLTTDKNARLCCVRRAANTLEVFQYPLPPQVRVPEEISHFFPRDCLIVSGKPANEATITRTDRGLFFAKSVLDVGYIEQGQIFRGKVEIKNSSLAPLTVDSIKGSCGCVTGAVTDGLLPPGGSCTMTITFNTAAKAGIQQYYVAVGAGSDVAVMQLTGYISTKFSFYPRSIDFGTLSEHSVRQIRVLEMSGIDRAPILSAESVDNSLGIRVEHRRSNLWDRPEDIIYVEAVPAKFARGNHDISIRVKFVGDSPDAPGVETDIPVRLWVP